MPRPRKPPLDEFGLPASDWQWQHPTRVTTLPPGYKRHVTIDLQTSRKAALTPSQKADKVFSVDEIKDLYTKHKTDFNRALFGAKNLAKNNWLPLQEAVNKFYGDYGAFILKEGELAWRRQQMYGTSVNGMVGTAAAFQLVGGGERLIGGQRFQIPLYYIPGNRFQYIFEPDLGDLQQALQDFEERVRQGIFQGIQQDMVAATRVIIEEVFNEAMDSAGPEAFPYGWHVQKYLKKNVFGTVNLLGDKLTIVTVTFELGRLGNEEQLASGFHFGALLAKKKQTDAMLARRIRAQKRAASRAAFGPAVTVGGVAGYPHAMSMVPDEGTSSPMSRFLASERRRIIRTAMAERRNWQAANELNRAASENTLYGPDYVNLPYRGQPLANPTAARYQYWRAMWAGNTVYEGTVTKSGKHLYQQGTIIDPGEKERTIAARIAYWDSLGVAPEWLLLLYGVKWAPIIRPYPIMQEIWKRVQAKLNEFIKNLSLGKMGLEPVRFGEGKQIVGGARYRHVKGSQETIITKKTGRVRKVGGLFAKTSVAAKAAKAEETASGLRGQRSSRKPRIGPRSRAATEYKGQERRAAPKGRRWKSKEPWINQIEKKPDWSEQKPTIVDNSKAHISKEQAGQGNPFRNIPRDFEHKAPDAYYKAPTTRASLTPQQRAINEFNLRMNRIRSGLDPNTSWSGEIRIGQGGHSRRFSRINSAKSATARRQYYSQQKRTSATHVRAPEHHIRGISQEPESIADAVRLGTERFHLREITGQRIRMRELHFNKPAVEISHGPSVEELRAKSAREIAVAKSMYKWRMRRINYIERRNRGYRPE